jgi:hypothetical protein
MTRSSNESVKASRNPATIAGRISGSVIDTKVRVGLAPRSIAASSSARSKPTSRLCTTTVTKHMVKVACAATMVQKPRSMPKATNKSSKDKPRTTSGMTRGA